MLHCHRVSLGDTRGTRSRSYKGDKLQDSLACTPLYYVIKIIDNN